ncbi:MAG: RnfABCDGE type electron transport complex subunit D [Bacteroidales bacterium]|jgi:electron transport complex protein RnfD|nr:RnfABCDGE type electron transport complex subunit D [Bacteroidales bacterium]
MNTLHVSGSPHVHSSESVKKIMWTVVIALLPTLLVSFWFFGFNAVRVTVVSVLTCVLLEWLLQRFVFKGKLTITDGSAVITGLLLAFNLPSNISCGIVIVGAIVAIGISKMLFGGLGKNPFNPALVGRVFLLISFPTQMTSWPKPLEKLSNFFSLDAQTGATPLGAVKQAVAKGENLADVLKGLPDYMQLMLGDRGGSLGEVAIIAILLGGIFMLIRKVITWHIPVSFIGTTFVFALILHLIDPQIYIAPSYHLLFGGLMLGAVFMATDMVTSPMSAWGKIVFGIGCGLLTILIRVWGSYPEGVSFAILIMNAFVPLINKGLKPKKFGYQKVRN